jgi:uncharacterized iron-regulated membrane protein
MIHKIISFTHLWLGLVSGLVVCIIATTGCIYVFQAEIQDISQPYRFVKFENESILPPSVLGAIAQKQLPGKKIHSVEYSGGTNAAKAIFYNYEPEYYYLVYLNPYNGEVLKVKNMNYDFFRVIIMGHYYLWLPAEIGKPIVAVSTLIFVVLLITGLVLWWPKTKKALKQSLTLKWNTGWQRKNYDLHNVVGFYISWVAVIIAFTGLVWGFQWFAKTVYFTASGGKSLTEYYEVHSDTSKYVAIPSMPVVDQLWKKTLHENPHAKIVEVHFPETKESTIAVNTNPDASTYWKTNYRYYDQYTLKEIEVNHMYGKYNDKLSAADKLMRMNYDIHVGSIWGFAGKVLAFLASLICASLPITGFIIWWNKRKQTQTRKSLLTELK